MTASSVKAGAAVTLRDVARVAGVHPATVSRALNEETRALVNEETARRVLKAAETLGYQPNPIARGLKTNRSYTIGVVVQDLDRALAQAEALGGSVAMPRTDNGYVVKGQVADPAGNLVTLIQG